MRSMSQLFPACCKVSLRALQFEPQYVATCWANAALHLLVRTVTICFTKKTVSAEPLAGRGTLAGCLFAGRKETNTKQNGLRVLRYFWR